MPAPPPSTDARDGSRAVEPLAAEFPAVTREQWRALVDEDALVTELLDGGALRPLYTASDMGGLPGAGEPGAMPYVRGALVTRDAWDLRTLYRDPDPSAARAAIAADLAGGADSLWLRLGSSGLAVADLPAVLAGVDLAAVPVALDAAGDCEAATRGLLEAAGRGGVDPSRLAGSLGADPIGWFARYGRAGDLDLLPRLAELTGFVRRSQPPPDGRTGDRSALCIATVDGTVYHDGGGSDVAELGCATAVGVAYLRALVDGGWAVDDALGVLEFRFAVTDDQFGSIAKLRAARRVWGRVAQLAGAAPALRGQRQHAVTSGAMLTRRDPWGNLLRTTIAAFAAAVGGADAITVLPFDHAIGLSDGFARRIARNSQAILHDESSLGRVLDPAGGSWYVEVLTQQLAERAWERFTAIERAGGALAYVGSGTLADDLAATRARRDEQIARRARPITGVSEFAFLGEQRVARPPAPSEPAAGPVAPHRYAEAFESLRDRADAAPVRPTVFLAALGPLSQHTARTSFAANLFAAGGIESITATGTTDEIVAAFRGSDARLACLCASDNEYRESGEEIATVLRKAGATQIWLAGRAEIPGVDRRISTGTDALEALEAAYDVVGASE